MVCDEWKSWAMVMVVCDLGNLWLFMWDSGQTAIVFSNKIESELNVVVDGKFT